MATSRRPALAAAQESWRSGPADMAEVKNRKKPGPKAVSAEPGKRSEGGKSPEARGGARGGWADPRTGLSLLSLGACLGLAW